MTTTLSVLAASAGLVVVAAGPALAADITSTGPLTSVTISPDLNCAVSHTGDQAGEFYGNTACGTLLAVGGTLYGPASIPAGGSASPRTAFTPVDQTTSGAGTAADPFRVVTVVDLGTSNMRITQTDSYVVGQESYRTDTTVTNNGAAGVQAVLYKAGDCYLQDSDTGFGAYDAATGAVSCVGATTNDQGQTIPGQRIEQFYPLSTGSSYYESFYDSVWAAVGSQQSLPNTCEQCATNTDNGAGLSWALTLAAGASATRSHLTTFSPLGIQPLTVTKTADAASAAAGAADGYTIKVHNPNGTAATVTSITDTLPAGFTYTAGSTTGASTSDPSVSGQQLTWSGSFPLAANGDLVLHFAVSVSTTPGTYYNNASATATDLAVAASGDTAPITVTAVNHAPSAADKSVSTPQDTAVGVTLSGSDPDGDALTFAVVSGPSHGTLSGTSPNLTYTPSAGYTGADSFTYKANDGSLDSAPATVSITVTAVNHAPSAADKSVSTPQDTAVGVTLSGSDPDGDALTFAVVSGPSHGTLSGTSPNLTYTPSAGYTGADSFTYKANDGSLDSAPATVSISVTPLSTGCPTAPTVDASVSVDRRSPSSSFTSPLLSTSHDGELVLAFVEADGPLGSVQKVTSVRGGGLSWTLASRANKTWGTTEVWQAWAPTALTGVRVTARLAYAYDGSMSVASFQGAAHAVGAVAGAAGTSGAASVTLTPSGCGSLVWGAGHDWTHAKTPVPVAGQSLVHSFIDTRVHDSFWTQHQDGATTDTSPVTLKATGMTSDRWTFAAVEIPSAG